MPSEGRVAHCPAEPPTAVGDIFGVAFTALHHNEAVTPEAGSTAADVLGGPVFRMKGFVQGGPGNVIFSKPYIQSATTSDGPVTENPLIELRHTPKQGRSRPGFPERA